MPTPATTTQKIREDARGAAAAVLDAHWDGVIPVDPVLLARALGVSVFNSQLGDDTWGMIIGSGESADIYLDSDQPYVRYRFSCAHELGHYVDHQSDLKPNEGYIDSRSNAGARTPHEIYANEFAASVLMPESEFRKAVASGDSLISIADDFEVSLDAARFRCLNLGIAL